MSYFATIFTILLMAIKVGLLVLNILTIRTGDVLKCNAHGEIVYYTDETGLYYMALFAAQMLVGAE